MMFDALSLLTELDDQDIEWILEAGQEEQVIANKVIIAEGSRPDALYFVLEGLLGITVSSAGSSQLATLGPGELVGEISFLEDRPASATVAAVENSLLLALPRSELVARLEGDSRFAAHLYKSFALISSRRLRERVGSLGQMLQSKAATDSVIGDRWRRIEQHVDAFKERLQELDDLARKHDGSVPEDEALAAVGEFHGFCKMINDQIGEAADLDVHVKEELGGNLKKEILPYLLLTQTAERMYSKPRGYAGDFLTIEQIYRNEPSGAGRLGPLLDRGFLNEPAAKAVRNRRGLLSEEIRRVLDETPSGPVPITSLACGPAQEVFDVLRQGDADQLQPTLIDIDQQALDFVAQRAAELGFSDRIRPINGNLVYLATGRTRLDLPPQKLIYSIGLIDYFNDKFVKKLMDYGYSLLAPGGKMILGNFHPANTTRALMDHVLEWRLIHRTEEDMDRLFKASRFGRPTTQIRFEAEGINLFAECVKEE
jgi:CRP-like cAMP-binding protein